MGPIGPIFFDAKKNLLPRLLYLPQTLFNKRLQFRRQRVASAGAQVSLLRFGIAFFRLQGNTQAHEPIGLIGMGFERCETDNCICVTTTL